MSYCRFSSNDWDCDVYVYESAYGGWTTHIAGNRLDVDRTTWPAPVPLPVGLPADHPQFRAWFDRYRYVMDAVSNADRVPIDLPHAGQTFTDDTPGECADRLEALRDLGYHVPQDAIDDLRKEQATHVPDR